jgi:AraC-like DNA-binding protein
MNPFLFNPPVTLAPYIAFYSIWDVDEGFGESYVLPPLGFCGFIICLDDLIDARLNGKPFMKGRYCAMGQRTAPLMGDLIGKNRTLITFMHPCGIYQLFGIDMSLLANTTMPITELLGEEKCQELIEKLKNASGNEKIIEVMNDFLLSKLPAFDITPIVSNALDYVHQNKGNVSVKEIEGYGYITARSLERHFKLCIGIGPKEYAMIYRFKCLLNFINESPGVSWAALCEQNGYYDQSHIARYFSRYLNLKPGDIVDLDKDLAVWTRQKKLELN